jgi:hypothetical protein
MPATLQSTLRSGLIASLCLGATGCAILPAVGLNLAAQGAAGLVALGLGPLSAMDERSNPDQCSVFAGKGISVSESLESSIPADEGEVRTFEPVYWRPEFAIDGYPQVERSRASTEGKLAITERSLLFVPPPGALRIRIPYQLVQDVEVRASTVPGAPRSLVVKSCSGRFDVVTFEQRPPEDPGEAMSAAVVAQLKARVAAFRAAADN